MTTYGYKPDAQGFPVKGEYHEQWDVTMVRIETRNDSKWRVFWYVAMAVVVVTVSIGLYVTF